EPTSARCTASWWTIRSQKSSSRSATFLSSPADLAASPPSAREILASVLRSESRRSTIADDARRDAEPQDAARTRLAQTLPALRRRPPLPPLQHPSQDLLGLRTPVPRRPRSTLRVPVHHRSRTLSLPADRDDLFPPLRSGRR